MKVIAFLDWFTYNFACVRYLNLDTTSEKDIRLFILRMWVQDLSISSEDDFFNAYEEQMIQHLNTTRYEYMLNHPEESLDEVLAIEKDEINKKKRDFDKTCNDIITRNGCCDGSPLTYDTQKMSEEEFANPDGSLDSPYNDYGDPPTKYPFFHPITGALMTRKDRKDFRNELEKDVMDSVELHVLRKGGKTATVSKDGELPVQEKLFTREEVLSAAKVCFNFTYGRI